MGLRPKAWHTIEWGEKARMRTIGAICRGPNSRWSEQRIREVSTEMVADQMAQRRERARQILALDPYHGTSHSATWLTRPNYAGTSSATIRNSSRRSARAC